MLENDKYYNASISLIIGIIVFVVGILLFAFNESFYKGTIKLLLILLLINGIVQFAYSIRKRNNKSNLIKCIINLLIALILYMIPAIPQSIFPLLIGLYLVLYAIIKIFIFVLYKKDNVSNGYKELIEALFLLYLSYVIALNPLENLAIILYATAIYFLFLGLSFIIDSIFTFIPIKIKKKNKVSLPLLFQLFIPYTYLLNISKNEEKENIIVSNESKNIKSNLEILVHVSNDGYGKVGHLDFIYKDKVYSYGNYDYKSRKFFETIGDGVLFIANKKEYIKLCIDYGKKILFGFGLNVDDKQMNIIENNIKKIMENCYEWNIDKKKKDYSYYIYMKAKAKFYKFKKTKFKSYFICNSSCCEIVNEVAKNTDINILKMRGILSPGSYYDRLNREYVNKSDLILYRNIYTNKSFNSYFDEN